MSTYHIYLTVRQPHFWKNLKEKMMLLVFQINVLGTVLWDKHNNPPPNVFINDILCLQHVFLLKLAPRNCSFFFHLLPYFDPRNTAFSQRYLLVFLLYLITINYEWYYVQFMVMMECVSRIFLASSWSPMNMSHDLLNFWFTGIITSSTHIKWKWC